MQVLGHLKGWLCDDETTRNDTPKLFNEEVKNLLGRC